MWKSHMLFRQRNLANLKNMKKISLTYYADQVLTDENNEEVDDVEEIVGEESLDTLGSMRTIPYLSKRSVKVRL